MHSMVAPGYKVELMVYATDPLETAETQRFFEIFRVYGKRPVA